MIDLKLDLEKFIMIKTIMIIILKKKFGLFFIFKHIQKYQNIIKSKLILLNEKIKD